MKERNFVNYQSNPLYSLKAWDPSIEQDWVRSYGKLLPVPLKPFFLGLLSTWLLRIRGKRGTDSLGKENWPMGQNQEQHVKVETIIRCCLSGKPKLKHQHPIQVQVQLEHVRKPRTHVQVSEARTQTPAVWMGPVPTGRPSSVPFYGCCKSTGTICFLTLPAPHRSFRWLDCQFLLRPEMLPEVYGTSGVSLKSSPIPSGQFPHPLKSSGTSFSSIQ